MANLLSMPSMTVGLMGRRPGVNNNTLLQQLLAQSQAAQYDAGDDYFANPQSRPAGSGVPVLENGAVGYVPPTQGGAPAQRDRVSGWRVLDRVLGGETITGGLDSERARLQAQADAPQQRARIEAALGGITDPRERALFLGLGGEDWQKNVGQQYAPQVIAPGAIQAIGGRAAVGAPQQYDQGDQRRSFDPVTRQDILVNERGPTIAERTAQDRLAWDREYGVGQLGVSAQNADTSRMNAETTAANAGSTLSPGQVRYDINGNPVASVAAAPNPAAAATAQAVAGFAANNERFKNLLGMINGNPEAGVAPAFDLSPTSALRYQAELATGLTSPEAAAWGNYQSEIDAAVADALRLNTGPQTDQDAIREAKALLSNRNNKAYVNARLPTIMANNDRLAQARQAGSPAAAQSGSVASPTSAAEYQALPSGTLFLAPDGSTRRKP